MTSRWSDVRRDLAAFCDLGAEVEVREYPSHIEFELPRNGSSIRGRVEHRNLKFAVRLEAEAEAVPYHHFLASEQMANLGKLARQTTLLEREFKRRSRRELTGARGSVVLYNCFVPQHLRIEGRSTGSSGLDALDELVGSESAGGTRIVFLSAQAGQGKSSLLDVFTIRQAERFLASETSKVCLYVDAQGRGLARLDEAIARQLNDLQFMLSYNAVVSLVREGMLTLVVDGFDELIGSRGTYDDAFGSLSNFIETLEGRGTLVAATRSSYFTQEYGSRGSLLDADDEFAYELMLAELLPWDKRAQREYFDRVVAEASLSRENSRQAQREFSRLQSADNANLLSRPLFARDMSLLVVDEWTVTAGEEIRTTPELVSVLADSYMQREVDTKLLTRDRSRILSVEDLPRYYIEIAGEMWRLETRELDGRTLKELAELLIEVWSLSTEGGDIVRARYASLPFLEIHGTSKTAAFEHEVFFSYFLAKSLAPEIWEARPGVAQALLSKAALDAVASDFIAAELRRLAGSVEAAVSRLCGVAHARHPREKQIRMNCGALVAALLHGGTSLPGSGSLELSRVAHVDFAGEDLSDLALHIKELEDIEFARCDFSRTHMSAESTSAVILRDPLLDPASTRLFLVGIDAASDVQGVRVVGDQGIQTEYDAARIAEILREVGLAESDEPHPLYDIDPVVVQHIAAIAHAYEQLNPIGTKHHRVGHLFTSRDRDSRAVIRLLEERGLIAQVTKAASGPPQLFYRKRFVSARLMEGLWALTGEVEIDEFWRQLAETAPATSGPGA